MANSLSIVGLVLSVAGALLDFSAATTFLQNPAMSTGSGMGMMTPGNPATTQWSVALYGLGAVLLITGILGVTSLGMGRMKVFGGLMSLYGAIMLWIGWAMLSGWSPMMQGAIASSAGMFMVGAGMIGNGLIMVQRANAAKRSM